VGTSGVALELHIISGSLKKVLSQNKLERIGAGPISLYLFSKFDVKYFSKI